jgi:hypothetical protein
MKSHFSYAGGTRPTTANRKWLRCAWRISGKAPLVASSFEMRAALLRMRENKDPHGEEVRSTVSNHEAD